MASIPRRRGWFPTGWTALHTSRESSFQSRRALTTQKKGLPSSRSCKYMSFATKILSPSRRRPARRQPTRSLPIAALSNSGPRAPTLGALIAISTLTAPAGGQGSLIPGQTSTPSGPGRTATDTAGVFCQTVPPPMALWFEVNAHPNADPAHPRLDDGAVGARKVLPAALPRFSPLISSPKAFPCSWTTPQRTQTTVISPLNALEGLPRNPIAPVPGEQADGIRIRHTQIALLTPKTLSDLSFARPVYYLDGHPRMMNKFDVLDANNTHKKAFKEGLNMQKAFFWQRCTPILPKTARQIPPSRANGPF